MNEFNVEFFITSDDERKIMLSTLNEKEKKEWQENMELRALSEYHKRKIKISSKKI